MATGVVNLGAPHPVPPQKSQACSFIRYAFPCCANPSLGARAPWGIMTFADDGPHPDRVEEGEVILGVGAEGGSLTILGARSAAGWRFRALRNEYAFLDFLSGEDRDGFEFWSGSGWLASWDRALSLFDKYPWHRSVRFRSNPISSGRFGRQWRNDIARTSVGVLTASTAGIGCAIRRWTDLLWSVLDDLWLCAAQHRR
jgi:hypothetical protein